jgi:hypothetical protein
MRACEQRPPVAVRFDTRTPVAPQVQHDLDMHDTVDDTLAEEPSHSYVEHIRVECIATHVQVPIYMTEGMATRAGALYATLSEWCSQGVQLTAASARANPFAQPRFQVRPMPTVVAAVRRR